MPATVGDIVTEAQKLVGEVAGIGVQTYGEDLMLSHVIRGFNMMHTKYPWDEYNEWVQLALDGSTGRLVVNNNEFQYVRDFGDFLTISPTQQTVEIALLHRRENPFRLTGGTGFPARYTSIAASDADFATKRLQFYPKTSTGTLDIQLRVYPVKFTEDINEDTELFLDKDLLTYAAAFQTLAFDDTNSNALNVIQNMLDIRYNDLTANRASKPMQISGGNGIPMNWSECR